VPTFDLGHQVQLIDGERELFGDGRVVCLPSDGHTARHQSLRVRLDKREVVFTADACYMCRTLEQMVMHPVAHNHDAMREVLGRFRTMERTGALGSSATTLRNGEPMELSPTSRTNSPGSGLI
jgi:N-acyl homoserine lactone hydrolase